MSALNRMFCTGAGSGRADQEWSSLADVILAWALDPSSITGVGLPTPGLYKTLSMEGKPPTPGPPSDSSDTAWENLVNSDFHRYMAYCSGNRPLGGAVHLPSLPC